MVPPRRWALPILLPALLATLLALAACGGTGDGTDPPRTPEPSGSPAFPVTVGTGDAAVEIPARPERIVSMSPTATETLYAVGAGDQVVAVDANSDYPAGVPTTDISGFEPNLEAISTYDPDLVVTSNDPDGFVSRLAQIGVPALLHPSAVTLDDTYRQIAQIGLATGHSGAANALVERMRSELDAIVAELPARPEPLTYYHELTTSYHSVTSDTFLGELYGLLGMRSIADQAGSGGEFPQLSAEFIVDADPDVILLATVQCCDVDAAAVADRPGWDRLTAVREGRIVELDEDLASRWGPRVVDFLRTLAADLAALAPAG